jgi:hypothetical protein
MKIKNEIRYVWPAVETAPLGRCAGGWPKAHQARRQSPAQWMVQT